MKPMQQNTSLKIVYTDDDVDDRFFFSNALSEIPIENHLTILNDGEQLMHYLHNNYKDIPDILFLDLSMPRKTGIECLFEIKENELLKNINVVMLSTSYKLDIVYENSIIESLLNIGAQGYIRKQSNLEELKKSIQNELIKVVTKKSFNI